jgi:hypothetical protein
MSLTETQKVDLRRHLGYGMRGDNPSAIDVLYARNTNPFFEDRMNHLTTEEESFLIDRLTLLNDMEQEYFDCRGNFDTLEAGAFKQNPDEVKLRRRMLNRARKEVAVFLEVPFNGQGGVQFY